MTSRLHHILVIACLVTSVHCSDDAAAEPAAVSAARDAEVPRDEGARPSRDAGADVVNDAGFRRAEPTLPSTSAEPRTISCGARECSVAPNPLLKVLEDFRGFQTMLLAAEPCCLDDVAAPCGITPAPGADCEPLAIPDARCPGLDLHMLTSFAEGMNLVGCCIAGACGQDGSLLGRGCIENDEAAANFSFIPVIATVANFPAARSCNDPRDADRDEDGGAGAPDAGR
ncbi:MAG: hypothetical protein ABW321_14155 [Polyangiales bacterium]